MSDQDQGHSVAVIGASGALGAAFIHHLAAQPHVRCICALSRSGAMFEDSKIINVPIDIENEKSIENAAQACEPHAPFDLVLIATGILHDGAIQPEKSISQLQQDHFIKVLSINTVGPALIARSFLPLMQQNKRAVFAALSARVGSISDNALGGWISYRASKAALNMVIKTLSIEAARRNPEIIIASLHPGTVKSALSQPFQKSVPADALQNPEQSALRLLQVIDDLRPQMSGKIFDHNGVEIPA